MDQYLKVGDLIEQLMELPPDMLVMIAVVKYPEEFTLKLGVDGTWAWTDSTDVDCIMLEAAEPITVQRGVCTIAVELTDYSLERHVAGT